MRFDKNRFTCQCETRQKGLRVQILLFYWSFSSDIVAVKRLICLNFLQKGRETCARITCYDGGACDPAEPCKKRGLHAAPVIRAKPAVPAVKPHLLGGYEPAELADIQEAVDFAVEKINSMSNSLYRMVPEEVTHMTKQVCVCVCVFQFVCTVMHVLCMCISHYLY